VGIREAGVKGFNELMNISKVRMAIEALSHLDLKSRNGGLAAPGIPLYFLVMLFVLPLSVGFIGLFMKNREMRFGAYYFSFLGLLGYSTFLFLTEGILWAF
jgi:hypothetical protein